MQTRKLRVTIWAMALWMGTTVGVLFAADRSATEAKATPPRDGTDGSGARLEEISAAPHEPVLGYSDVEIYPLPDDVQFETWVAYPDGRVEVEPQSVVAGGGERLVYSNILGRQASALPINTLVSDDISTTAANNCAMKRFTFQVTGKVNPSGTGGPYTVNYGLYQFCPGSLSPANRASILVPGTNGSMSFPDDLPRTVNVILPPNTLVPNNFYLGISFNRSNAGVVVGTPPLVGHSCDLYDAPSTVACASFFGGFPNQPHASFNAEFYADANCPDTFIGYRAHNPKQPFFNPGANVWLVDDLRLNTNNCNVVSYEVMVKGIGFYTFELRNTCAGGALPDSQRSIAVTTGGSNPQKVRFDFDPPIPLSGDLVWFATQVGTLNAGIISPGSDACTGSTSDIVGFQQPGALECQPTDINRQTHSSVDVTITCEGSPPIGACCDMFVLDQNGEPVCRQVPQMNCPFPPRNSDLYPKWMEGAPCEPSPFPQPCGQSACCGLYLRPDPFNPKVLVVREDCENRTQSQCSQQHVVTEIFNKCSVTTNIICETSADCPAGEFCGSPSLWQRGQYCGFLSQSCPRVACLGRGGDCTLPHTNFGCNDAFCCDAICRNWGDLGTYCCEVEWDQTCVDLVSVEQACDNIRPSNDECYSSRAGFGARLISVPGSAEVDITNATTNEASDPDFCCHSGVPPRCVGGPLDGFLCESNEGCCEFDCGQCKGICQGGPTPGAQCFFPPSAGECGTGGTCVQPTCQGGPLAGNTCGALEDCCDTWCGVCPGRQPTPGDGVNSVWFKFVAPNTSVELSTCLSNSPADDSLLQVFEAGDPTNDQTACSSLIPIGCSDDVSGCADSDLNSRVCVKNLTVGQTYYVLLSAKNAAAADGATYRLTTIAPCTGQSQVPNDFCTNATVIPPGPSPIVTPFNTAGSTPDCPIDGCMPTALNDIWYDYTPNASGSVTIETCGTTVNNSPDTNLAVYLGCNECPPHLPEPIGCSTFVGGNCGFASRVTFTGQAGQCYRIRLADNAGNPVSGNLTILGQSCPTGSIVANTPPDNVVDARRPHDPADSQLLFGINQAVVVGPTGASQGCFSVCETTNGGTPNGISTVAPAGSNYTITLNRPIWPGALAKIKYGASSTTYLSHPGNVDADATTDPDDALALVSRLGGGPALPFGNFSQDIDGSGVFTPLDLLEEMDLLNGAGAYIVWLGSPKPTTNGNCQ